MNVQKESFATGIINQNNMQQIYVLVGVPASGKSTLSQKLVDEVGGVIVSRDAIRRMIYGYNDSTIHEYYMRPDISTCEERCSEFHDIMVREALLQGYNVIADNTHLRLQYIKKYFNYGFPIVPVYVHAELDECIERDSKREATVGAAFITEQYKNYQKMIDNKHEILKEVAEHNASLEKKKPTSPRQSKCVIFDIDGTLAHSFGRSPYDYSMVGTDTISPMVVEMYKLMLYSGQFAMFVCSGRDEECREETAKWLNDNGIHYDALMMRPNGDKRKDLIVKKEMWENIENMGFSIECMFDDRKQVVDFARHNGYKVFQVDRGNF